MKNSKILFVVPPYHCGVVEIFGRWLPLGFVYLAAAARLAGLDAEIYDAVAKDHGYPEIEAQLRRFAPAYVAATAVTSSLNAAVQTLELAKRINPQVVTILGGIHPTFCAEEVLHSTTAVDYIVCGEGEVTLGELLRTLEAGADPGTVHGLAFRLDGGIVRTAARPLAEDIDALPAAWDLLDWQEYQYFVIPGSRLGAISTARAADRGGGSSLVHKSVETTWRCRDPHKIVAELVRLYETYGVNVFLLTDECPTANRERWEIILDLLLERNLPVHLLMQAASADIIRDRDIMWKYRRAGVIHVYIGIEPLEQAAPESTAAGLGVTEGKLALDIIHAHGMISEVSFVVGGPEETKESLERTLSLARYFNPDNAQFLPLTPWPYDASYAAVRAAVKVHDYAKYNLIDPVIEPRSMTLLQVEVAIADCYRRFYMGKLLELMTMKNLFKRDYLLRATKLMMVSPFIFRKMGLGIMARIPAKFEALLGKERL